MEGLGSVEGASAVRAWKESLGAVRRRGGWRDWVGAGGTFWSGRGRGKKKNSIIMGERRPAPALIAHNVSHVVLFISAFQESIQGAFLFSTLSI